MSQITVFQKNNQIINAFIVNVDLFDWLTLILESNNLESFNLDFLQELKEQFLLKLIDRFNLKVANKNKTDRLNKAHFFAFNLYPWYSSFTRLINEIEVLSHHYPELTISLTSR